MTDFFHKNVCSINSTMWCTFIYHRYISYYHMSVMDRPNPVNVFMICWHHDLFIFRSFSLNSIIMYFCWSIYIFLFSFCMHVFRFVYSYFSSFNVFLYSHLCCLKEKKQICKSQKKWMHYFWLAEWIIWLTFVISWRTFIAIENGFVIRN